VLHDDCKQAAPSGFTIADGKDQISGFGIGTDDGYSQDLCIKAFNG